MWVNFINNANNTKVATLGIKPITFWYAPNNLAMLAHTYTHAHTPTNLPLHICTIELCQYYICINQWFKFIYGWHRKYTHALTPMLHKYYDEQLCIMLFTWCIHVWRKCLRGLLLHSNVTPKVGVTTTPMFSGLNFYISAWTIFPEQLVTNFDRSVLYGCKGARLAHAETINYKLIVWLQSFLADHKKIIKITIDIYILGPVLFLIKHPRDNIYTHLM